MGKINPPWPVWLFLLGALLPYYLVSAVLCPIGKRWTLWLFFHCLESLSLDLGEGIFMFGALILLGVFPTAHSFAICSTLPSSESTFSSLWKVKIPKKCELLSLAGYPWTSEHVRWVGNCLLWLGIFCCLLCWKALDHILSNCDFS